MTIDHTLPCGMTIRVYEHGGIDILCEDRTFRSVTTDRESTFLLGHIAIEASEHARKQEELGKLPT